MSNFLFKLSTEDAERYGVAELEYDSARPRFTEVRELKRQLGLNLPEFGKLCEDTNEQDYVLGVIVWLALMRVGKKVPFEEFDLDVRGVQVDVDEAENDPNSSAPEGATTN